MQKQTLKRKNAASAYNTNGIIEIKRKIVHQHHSIKGAGRKPSLCCEVGAYFINLIAWKEAA